MNNKFELQDGRINEYNIYTAKIWNIIKDNFSSDVVIPFISEVIEARFNDNPLVPESFLTQWPTVEEILGTLVDIGVLNYNIDEDSYTIREN